MLKGRIPSWSSLPVDRLWLRMNQFMWTLWKDKSDYVTCIKIGQIIKTNYGLKDNMTNFNLCLNASVKIKCNLSLIFLSYHPGFGFINNIIFKELTEKTLTKCK